MGSGGNAAERNNSNVEVIKRAPVSKPPFTLADLKKAVPPHLFERSLLWASFYLFVDLFFASLFFYIATTYIVPLSAPFSLVAWPLYWIVQGSVLNGLWVLGHECGHQAFSDYGWLNDIVGFILHTSLLAPYFSWKVSHRRHHSNNASLQHDETFVPKKKTNLNAFASVLNTPPGRVIRLMTLCTVGWLLYVFFNVSGRPYEKRANHFEPNSPIYKDRERFLVLVSDIGLLGAAYVLYKLALAKGFTWLVAIYFVPLLVVYGLLVVITWLHHTHPALPHYDSTEWNWLIGGLSTVDRDYGILNWVLNHIPDAHVVHHLFTTMPHYNSREATKYVKPILGEYYQFDDTPIFKAMWRECTKCFYVMADEGEGKNKGIYWFNNKL